MLQSLRKFDTITEFGRRNLAISKPCAAGRLSVVAVSVEVWLGGNDGEVQPDVWVPEQ